MVNAIAGTYDPAFSAVADAFLENFNSRGELGGSCCVVIDGKTVVDIWGGVKQRAHEQQPEQPWDENTIAGFYSVGKPLAALCLLQLIDQGLVGLDPPPCQLLASVCPSG